MASIPLGLIPLATFTTLALLASLFLASITTEILKVLQVRMYGAVTRVAGRAAVWVRFLGTIIFFAAFYFLYFALYHSVSLASVTESIASVQKMLWFIPYLWPSVVLSAFTSGLGVEATVLSFASLAFIYVLTLAAVRLNARFGMYEAPAITVSRGEYTPKASMLGRLGLSPLETAVIKKDFKAFTRRQELMFIFIFPIFSVIVALIAASASMVNVGQGPMPPWFRAIMFFWLTMIPGPMIAISLGQIAVGTEGGSVWYIHSSPITARSLVRAKQAFVMLFSMVAMSVSFVVGLLFTPPQAEVVTISMVETVLLIISLSTVALSFGIKGADFREFPRPRMIRPLWNFVNLIVCLLLAFCIVLPVIPYGLKVFFGTMQAPAPMSISLPASYIYVALPMSGIIAFVATYAFHRIAIKNAEEFLSQQRGVED